MDKSKDHRLEELLKRAWEIKLGQGREQRPEENREPKDDRKEKEQDPR